MEGYDFLSSLSHEIRTPLNGIVGYTQLLSHGKLDRVQQSYVNAITKCSIQLMELVNDILDFSKLTTGHASINSVCFSSKELVSEINSALDFRIKEKKQKLQYIFSENFPEYVISDKNKIVQVLINLVSNANKFTEIGGRIIVHLGIKGEKLLFSVEDDGIGISIENQKNLFKPFYQVQETLTKNGSGLGLAISTELVKLLGGELSVDSEKGEGSIFTFTVTHEPYEEYQKNIETSALCLKGQYVLVISGNVDDRLNIGDILFDHGMFPILCASPREGEKLGERYDFSAVIADCDVNYTIPVIKVKESEKDGYEKNCIYKPINKSKLLSVLVNSIGKNEEVIISKVEIDHLNLSILIAEDNVCNSELLCRMLESLNYTNIKCVENGKEAIAELNKNKYDILLLDLKMPVMSGIEVAEYISRNSINVKVSVLTASVLETDKESCKKYGIKNFLFKPYHISQLKNLLNKLN
jgi:CheY-like chemotaxis protein/anti-sigma regulatory factor (Ser/Thr protein kinase)